MFRATDSFPIPTVVERAKNNGVVIFAVGIGNSPLSELLVIYSKFNKINILEIDIYK